MVNRLLTHTEHLSNAIGRLIFDDSNSQVDAMILTPSRTVIDLVRGDEHIRISITLIGNDIKNG